MQYDVVMNYDWTSVPRGSNLRLKAPKAYIRSYKVKKNEAFKRVQSYLSLLDPNGDPMEFYKKLYSSSTEEQDQFHIPYFGDSIRSFSNEYGDTFQSGMMGTIDTWIKSSSEDLASVYSLIGGEKGLNSMKEAFNTLKDGGGVGEAYDKLNLTSSPGSYIETPRLYQYANNDAPLTIDFVLSNTINSDYQQNTELIEHLIRINRPTRNSPVEMEPPHIYNVQIPGLRYMEWAYCNSLDIRLLGTRREINGKIIPEGYMVSMSLASLTTEVSNFMDKI